MEAATDAEEHALAELCEARVKATDSRNDLEFELLRLFELRRLAKEKAEQQNNPTTLIPMNLAKKTQTHHVGKNS